MKIYKKIIIFVIVFAVGAGAGVGGTFLKTKFFSGGNAEAGQAEKIPDEIGPLVEMDEFMVNLKGGGMLKTEITLEGFDKNSAEPLQEKIIFLRDKVITVLSSKTAQDVSSATGKEELKKELIQELNKVCNDQLQDVLFKSFIYSI